MVATNLCFHTNILLLKLCPYFVRSFPEVIEVCTKLALSLFEGDLKFARICPEFVRNWPEVCIQILFEILSIDRLLLLAPALLGSERASNSCPSSFGSEVLASVSHCQAI